MSNPKRVQRKRTKDWKMPPDTIYVGRPTQWGNPFSVDSATSSAQAVSLFENYILGRIRNGTGYPLEPLRGKNLACWCKEGEPCHADVLLRLANKDRK